MMLPLGVHTKKSHASLPSHVAAWDVEGGALGGALGTDLPCGHLLTQYHLQLMCLLLA